jgi:glucose-1-phosphate adenylyltransferase
MSGENVAMETVLSIVLGGGRGERLYPLTKERAKPAVPFGGRYRLVDIPISNCINSDLRQIFILTQFNSASLHNHVASTYVFDTFSRAFVEVLAAQQTFEHSDWYHGTADAVRKNFLHFRDLAPDYYLILGGDQLYRMDFRELLRDHVARKAEVTIAAKPVPRDRVTGLGIMAADESGRISGFVEKPHPEANISHLRMPPALAREHGLEAAEDRYLASMGIYVFSAAALQDVLSSQEASDFGKEVIPAAIAGHRVYAHPFDDFWEDIGTIRTFYQTSLGLTPIQPEFNFYDERRPIYTHRRDLPATKLNSCYVFQSLIAEGSILTYANIMNSVVGIRTRVEPDAHLDGVVCMGADRYETDADIHVDHERGIPEVGIGRGTQIRRAIIDKNARIGWECKIGLDDRPRPDGDYEAYSVREGIIVVHKNAVIPNGTTI